MIKQRFKFRSTNIYRMFLCTRHNAEIKKSVYCHCSSSKSMQLNREENWNLDISVQKQKYVRYPCAAKKHWSTVWIEFRSKWNRHTMLQFFHAFLIILFKHYKIQLEKKTYFLEISHKFVLNFIDKPLGKWSLTVIYV